ncbi:hypothetical protein [Microvirga yunnanensis]|uniref:hypothetical protein n=1 Tax=Microvirga yunnanensis TaxID=2953740 RepID=UPI0021CA6A13|nr:hypothetical protein [Microvirga sp. HBU67655]
MYWHTRRKRWSLRVAGRVADHLPVVALQACRMVVREAERQRCIARGQRSVHAWIQGTLVAPPPVDEAFVEIAYSPWYAGHFTRRPGFAPIREADLVVFGRDGKAWALVEFDPQLESAS